MSEAPQKTPRLQTVDRAHMLLRPVIVEQLIPDDHPAGAIWEFVARLDLRRDVERIRAVEGTAGRPALDPSSAPEVRVRMPVMTGISPAGSNKPS